MRPLREKAQRSTGAGVRSAMQLRVRQLVRNVCHDAGVGRRVDVDELVGAAEIAERLGVKRLQVVHDWRRRHEEFPLPVVAVSRTLVWHWPEVRRWAIQTGRLVANERVRVTGPHHNEAPEDESVFGDA